VETRPSESRVAWLILSCGRGLWGRAEAQVWLWGYLRAAGRGNRICKCCRYPVPWAGLVSTPDRNAGSPVGCAVWCDIGVHEIWKDKLIYIFVFLTKIPINRNLKHGLFSKYKFSKFENNYTNEKEANWK